MSLNVRELIGPGQINLTSSYGHLMMGVMVKTNASWVSKLHMSGENQDQNASTEKTLNESLNAVLAPVLNLTLNAILATPDSQDRTHAL